MALPKLNDTPKYNAIIPSTGKTIHFRPYLVKEEKILLLAAESQDPAQTLSAIADTVVSCIHEEIRKESLTTFDVEFLFLKIRAKSVGENSHIGLTCKNKECKSVNEVTINIDDIKIENVKKPDRIKLTDKISLKMKWPSFQQLTQDAEVIGSNSETEQAFIILIHCIESIMTEEENFVIADLDKSEVIEFIESMNSEQYKLLSGWAQKMPKLEHDVEFTCENCGRENKIHLDGIYDFF